MNDVIAIIAPGEMGSAVGRRLREHGATVITTLAGRSAASAARAGLGLRESEARLVEEATILLSIVPPGEALALAERLAPALRRAAQRPIFADCNAVSPQTAQRIGVVLAGASCPYVDAGIIGPPPAAGARTVFYLSGERASELMRLNALGLTLRVLDGPVGAASALKMSYAGLTKGVTALAAAMALGAARGGTSAALLQELRESQPALLAYLARLPMMFPKAYRWVAEMEEIAAFLAGDPAAQHIYQGTARLYERLAQGAEGELGALADFAKRAGDAKK
jgi:3-hydroxyisobutyrate dehydrogenase-like beta-hydroxyacid dehydrogenase